jgi:hypothetical protein
MTERESDYTTLEEIKTPMLILYGETLLVENQQ